MVNAEMFYGELEQQGEAVTQDKVDQRLYSGGRHELAVAWLERKRTARQDADAATRQSARSEQIELARRATVAAEDAAGAARDATRHASFANWIAGGALLLAALALVISFVGLN